MEELAFLKIVTFIVLVTPPVVTESLCQERLGVEDGGIPDSQLTASTVYDNNHAASKARLNHQSSGSSAGAWSAQHSDANQWIQVDLRVATWVTGVLIQGRHGGGSHNHYVTQFKVAYSDDGEQWQVVQETDNQGDMLFDGNADKNTVVTHYFVTPIKASLVRIHPTAWNDHISLRFELLGCADERDGCRHDKHILYKDSKLENHLVEEEDNHARNSLACESRCNALTSCQSFNWHRQSSTCEINDSTKDDASPGDFVGGQAGWVHHQRDTSYKGRCDDSLCRIGTICNLKCTLKSGMKRACKDCIEPIGMENDDIQDSKITATHYESSNWEPHRARLNNNKAWSTHNLNQDQYIQVELNQQQYITGVITQGKDDAWVTQFKVEYTPDGTNWDFVSDTEGGEPKIFEGNTDADTAVTNMFPRPIFASTVRLRPTGWHQWINVRMEWLGCVL